MGRAMVKRIGGVGGDGVGRGADETLMRGADGGVGCLVMRGGMGDRMGRYTVLCILVLGGVQYQRYQREDHERCCMNRVMYRVGYSNTRYALPPYITTDATGKEVLRKGVSRICVQRKEEEKAE